MVFEQRMERVCFKNAQSLVKLTSDLKWDFSIALTKNPMEFYFHRDLR